MGRNGRVEGLRRMAKQDPKLAARLILMTMPAGLARVREEMDYELEIAELGLYRITTGDEHPRVERGDGGQDVDFRLQADARTLAELASGAVGPVRLMLSGRLRIRGNRRKALKLRALGGEPPDMSEVVRAGGRLEPDIGYRALPYLIDPEWTRGHSFIVRYEVGGPRGGAWNLRAGDGRPMDIVEELPVGVEPDAVVRLDGSTYERLAGGEISPAEAMQNKLTEVEGKLYPVTILGRWIDRAQGRDDAELAREQRQRDLQGRRTGVFSNGAVPAGQGDPGSEEAQRDGRDGRGLLDYRQLYALWERQNWKATEIDFSQDREHWLATPTPAQENQIWSLGSFYVGEERVTADLAPFLLAAPTGEIELFLATQLVDEARHVAFFDRFGAEVMALSAEDLRGRMREVEQVLRSPWREVFDDGLRDVANRLKANPDDVGLLVEGVATYHLIVEGFLAVTGQAMIREYMLDHSIYPGFCEGFGLVERDEHRHIAFGVRYLSDAIAEDSSHRAIVERVVLDLAPRAAHVFVPPYVDDPREFVSYGYHSSEIYGYAYRALKRRLKLLDIELPPPEELMPGPVEPPAPVTAAV